MTKGGDDSRETVGEELPDAPVNELIDDEAVDQLEQPEEESLLSGEMENPNPHPNPSENVERPVDDPSVVLVGNNEESRPTEEPVLSDNQQASTEPVSDNPSPLPPPPADGNTDDSANVDVPNESKTEGGGEGDDHIDIAPENQTETATLPNEEILGSKAEENENGEGLDKEVQQNGTKENDVKEESSPKHEVVAMEERSFVNTEGLKHSFSFGRPAGEGGGSESGTEEEQAAFMKELENFFKERSMEFKPPKFYGEGLNCLKLYRAVTRLGGYDQVTTGKLWRQVGDTFNPPKTCTTVSWTFRCFYEKALLDYERHTMHGGEFHSPDPSSMDPPSVENQLVGSQASGSGRARRDAAARAMQGWHSQRLLGNGEVSDPIIKDKNAMSAPKRENQFKSVGMALHMGFLFLKSTRVFNFSFFFFHRMETMVVDIGPAADWVKVNVRRTKDCFEVYALVPGLLREEVRVQSDPAGRLVISGEPEQPDNPWGVTPFKKVISLPSRIDPHQTSAVVTLHGQLFVRVPFEQSDL
ncbi:ARID/BRIGHT DNA-binding domain [Macleaya cordata]|uniref:ARID/BRIGHT DNA-binding domain n=1 Tax=Macleaya cordata TaxID=56857 RepID=A0A200PR43_MACCD|nr:ARID/BRIGHT DNA-binding domain [Macleaya cordata]